MKFVVFFNLSKLYCYTLSTERKGEKWGEGDLRYTEGRSGNRFKYTIKSVGVSPSDSFSERDQRFTQLSSRNCSLMVVSTGGLKGDRVFRL